MLKSLAAVSRLWCASDRYRQHKLIGATDDQSLSGAAGSQGLKCHMHDLLGLLNAIVVARFTTLWLCFSLFGVQAADAPMVQPTGGPWDAGAGFQFDLGKKKAKKARQSVSGMACNLDGKRQRICLIAFDEGTQARYAYLENGALVPDPQVVLLGGMEGELDAEAAATDGHDLYVTGSHSAKRSDCSSNPASRHVIRLHLNPANGRAVAEGSADTGRLWSLMQAQSELRPYVGENRCLGSETAPGINIEGMALRDGRLYFGFRGPVIQKKAFVLDVDAQALFSGGDPKPMVSRLALGDHRGVRDMVAVADGLLLLAGPDDDAAGRGVGWAFFWWNGKATSRALEPRLLATLDLTPVKLRACDETLKPEALTILDESPQAYKVLVLSDGMCDGGAMVFSVPKP